MTLILKPNEVGAPDWAQHQIGDMTTTLTQHLDLFTKKWCPVDWFSQDRFIARLGPTYRYPVTFRGKVQAVWAARRKLIKRYLWGKPLGVFSKKRG